MGSPQDASAEQVTQRTPRSMLDYQWVVRHPLDQLREMWGIGLDKGAECPEAFRWVVSHVHVGGLAAQKHARLGLCGAASVIDQHLKPGDQMLRANGKSEVDAILADLRVSEVFDLAVQRKAPGLEV